jgi:acyl-CoA synthetase (AMP-forming)/AMP-acid ligase II
MKDPDELAWTRWCANAEKHPDKEAIVHWVAGEEPYRWTFANLISAAESLTVSLIESGIKKGDVCAIIMRHNKNFYPLYLAIDNAGAIPAILAYPNPRLHPDKFRQGIEGMSQRSGLDWIFTERELEPAITPLIEKEHSTIKGLHFPLEWDIDRAVEKEIRKTMIDFHNSTNASHPLLLQHSSGTTGLQKPVLLSNRAVIQHAEYYGEAIGLNDNDKIVSWLPLYHDMGLIAAFHVPLVFGIPVIQLDTFEWVLVPSLLLQAISNEHGTISWLPNFAYNLMADKIRDEDLEGISLESWRMIINCSEPVRYDSHLKFIQKFLPYGLNPASLSTCYAMAETTFAVTQTPPNVPPSVLSVDRLELSKGKARVTTSGSNYRMCVSSGKTIRGCQVKILDNERNPVEDGTIGELVIHSDSMFDGYRNYPEKTAEVLLDGWYYSGDYGFKHGDDFYIIGRKKDIIIVAGNNIYPEDIEDALSKVDGITPGRVVAFGEEDNEMGSEQISVIAETHVSAEPEQKKLRLEIVKAGMAIDVTIGKVYLVPPRWLIKSSAGKPSRKANKERIVDASGSTKRSVDDIG